MFYSFNYSTVLKQLKPVNLVSCISCGNVCLCHIAVQATDSLGWWSVRLKYPLSHTDPLLALVDAFQWHLQNILLVSMDIQPAAGIPQVCSCSRHVALCLLLARLPPALDTQCDFQHWKMTEEGPHLTQGGEKKGQDSSVDVSELGVLPSLQKCAAFRCTSSSSWPNEDDRKITKLLKRSWSKTSWQWQRSSSFPFYN